MLLAACVVAPADAGEGREPSSRLFVLAAGGSQPGFSTDAYGHVYANADGSLLIDGQWPEGPLMRLGVDGSRSAWRLSVPGHDDPFGPVNDTLSMADGSMIVSGNSEIWRIRPDGTTTRIVGTGFLPGTSLCGFSGDGGPATAAQICAASGLALASDGSLLFADGENYRVRRVSPEGTISTVAGSKSGFGGDGGPATSARLSSPSDVLANPGGGFLVADLYNGRVRKVRADGRIVTVAGKDKGKSKPGRSNGDGGAATAALLDRPSALARLPGGALAIAEQCCIRAVGADGIITTLVDFRYPVKKTRRGDFAGRNGHPVESMVMTPEGGLAVSTVEVAQNASHTEFGSRQVVYYLAPRKTARTLVAIRDARASERRIRIVFDATQAGTAQVTIRRRGRLVAQGTRTIRPGRRHLGVPGAFGRAGHAVTLALTAPNGAKARNKVTLYTGPSLLETHLRAVLSIRGHEGEPHCQRMSARRIDCEIWQPPDLERDAPGPPHCVATAAFRLSPGGILFTREYRNPCAADPSRRFSLTPRWTGTWLVPFTDANEHA